MKVIMRTSRVFQVRARGPIACFTRPEMKVERVSYEVMTPSAARGLLEAVLWKPAIRWQIHSIAVLSPIRWISFRRNEVNSKASGAREFYADEDRAQRNTVALRDVDYGIEASMVLTAKAGADDTIRKFEEMFARRLERGQSFQQPYLGCREFAADVEPWDAPSTGIDLGIDRPLGLMFYDFDFNGRSPVPMFFHARLRSGVVHVPPETMVRAENGRGGPS
jgi:CRISPR-associated protein Cas5d